MKIVKFHPLERVGLPDMVAATGELTLVDLIRQRRVVDLPEGRTTGEAATSSRIINGFAASIATATTVLLTSGTAILPLLEGVTQRHGLVLDADAAPASYTLDFSAEAAGDYYIYVRAAYVDQTPENRVFWNPATAAEVIDNVETRRDLTWEVTYQSTLLAPPGNGEWTRIWKATVAAGPTVSLLIDERHSYYEGDLYDGSYLAQEWGDGANDHDDDRGLYGVTDRHQWTQAVRRQLGDIIGDGIISGATPHRWYRAPAITLKSLKKEHYAESDAPAVADQGKHIFVTIGAANRWWKLSTLGVAATNHNFHLAGEGGDAPVFDIHASGVTDQSSVQFQPKGSAVALSVGHVHSETAGVLASDFSRVLTKVAADHHRWDWRAAGGAKMVEVNIGAGAVSAVGSRHQVGEGVAVSGTGGYHVSERQVAMIVPHTTMRYAAASEWVLYGLANQVHAAAVYFESGKADDHLLVLVEDFPEGARLDHVDVIWGQDVTATARDLRMYVGRHTLTVDEVGETDPFLSGITPLSLNSVADHIEIGTLTGSILERFTPDQNNLDFTRAKDRLAIGFYTGDLGTPVYSMTLVRCVWTFSQVNGYPLSSTNTA